MPIITIENASFYKTEVDQITLTCQKVIEEIKEFEVKEKLVKALFYDYKFKSGTNTVIAKIELFEDEKRKKEVLHKLSSGVDKAIKKLCLMFILNPSLY